jgi:uncharacterized membrane protein YqgA involved in biofilm formation
MPTGVIINVFSVILGGIAGTLAGKKLTHEFKAKLTLIFGVCSMGMGISSIGLMKNMPAVIFTIVLGTAIGHVLNVGNLINSGAVQMQKPIVKLFSNQIPDMSQEEFISTLVTIIVLFCASGTGIYGSLDSGMTGDSTILISKSILDFFTAAIFACNLGLVVSVVAIPQFIIFFSLFMGAKSILPLTTSVLVGDFKACGGFLMLATGFRILKLKEFPIADMIPAMALVMPLSWLWTNVILPML